MMTDCPDCWDTPCRCAKSYLGSKIHAYNELKKLHAVECDQFKARVAKLEAALNSIMNEINIHDWASTTVAAVVQNIACEALADKGGE